TRSQGLDHLSHGLLQRPQIVDDDPPHFRVSDIVIVVPKNIPNVRNLAPWNLWLRRRQICRQMTACLRDALQASFNGIAQHDVASIVLHSKPISPPTDTLDVLEHVSQVEQRLRWCHQKILTASFTMRSRTSALSVSRRLTSTRWPSASSSRCMTPI